MAQIILLIRHTPTDAGSVRETPDNSNSRLFQVEWARNLAANLRQLAPQIPIVILATPQNEGVAQLAVLDGAQEYLLTTRIDARGLPKTVRSMIERAFIAEALFEEQERARVTLSSLSDAVICTDRTGRVTYLNTAGEKLTGWSRDQAAGRPVETFFRARELTLRISYLAQHDGLTDLPNRVLLKDRLKRALVLAERQRQRVAVLFIDVDRFRRIDDSVGHVVGDRLLQSLAQRLLTCVRSSDTVSREGGNEFVILLSELKHAADAAVVAEKLLLTLSGPHHIDQHNLEVKVSIGIATYPDDGTEAETLMRRADFSMHHAKDGGRNNYQFFDPKMNVRAVERQSLENDLRCAMERGELTLHYQPKMNLHSDEITGIEALVRWHHPRRGLVPPAQFIPLAEECGLIAPLGRWVLRQACQQAKLWQDAGLPAPRIAINVSTVELRAKDFLVGMRDMLLETHLDATRLELELTEAFLLQDSTSTAGLLRAISELGVGLALDDFGTGYSSLSHLTRFPIDTLKIDQSFIRDITTDDEDANMVSAVISMGRSLQMRVIAKGVETPQQLAFLREHGCPEGQGYFFSPPMNASQFTKFLGRCVTEPMSGLYFQDEPYSMAY